MEEKRANKGLRLSGESRDLGWAKEQERTWTMLEKNYSKLGNRQRDAWAFCWSSAWRAPVNGSPSAWPHYSSVGAGVS